jgi:pimeloyl-ACP methyl ester carboxylesterase
MTRKSHSHPALSSPFLYGSPDRSSPSACYPSDALPGSRDVQSPWGSMRAYEWGEEESQRKVLFIHGLSTPSPALGGIAKVMAAHGCRVMLIGKCRLLLKEKKIEFVWKTYFFFSVDLWGRGYSDTPSDLKHDSRLYAAEILLALSTSTVSWTGKDSGGFSIVGYSMGGAITMDFASYFPQLISSIVLIGPGGLYQKLPSEYKSLPVRYPNLFPRSYIKKVIRRLLNGPPTSIEHQSRKFMSKSATLDPSQAPEANKEQNTLNIEGIVNWEIDHHHGFVHSITSALRYGPAVRQHSSWKEVKSYVEGKCSLPEETQNRLQGQKILILLGKQDTVLPIRTFISNVEAALGAETIEIVEFSGEHTFPIVQPEGVASAILRFWKMETL